MQLTQSVSPPIPHQITQAFNDMSPFNRPSLRLGLLIELRKGYSGYLVASELCQELLLCRQIEIFVCLDLFL